MTPIIGITASSITASTSGNFQSIATVNGLGTGDGEINFTNIPSTYQHLQVRFLILSTLNDNQDLLLRLGTGGSIDTGSNYSWHKLEGNGSAATATGFATQTSIRVLNNAMDQTRPIVGVVDILDYANTNKHKTVRSLAGFDRNGSGNIDFSSGRWGNSGAVSNLRFIISTGTFTTTTQIALYGIKG